jgi:hypothetical protein
VAQASSCCQRGCDLASQGTSGGAADMLRKILEELMKLAKQDPQGVAQALKQNPGFTQMLQQGIGQV